MNDFTSGLVHEATMNVYRRMGDLVKDEVARRAATPCITAETFRLRHEACPRWRWLARRWLAWRARVWRARCVAAGNHKRLCEET